MLYSDELLEEVRTRNDIVDVISQYVALKRKGRNFFGLCPFHNEKSPSFSVSPDKQIFHCFGCNVGGNAFHFVTKIENVSFKESVQILANRANIELPKDINREDERVIQLKEDVYKLNKDAAEFFHKNLYQKSSIEAQNYIKKRKLGDNTLKSFLIGYAGNNNELLKFLKQKGYKEETMLASDLIGKKDGRLYDKFRHRIMFPIQDVRNRVIAFGGRVMDDSKPKYINSPENIVYSKGRNLFGLNVAKRESSGLLKKILVVEGYMDAISLYQRGITNVVASLGTALTDNQGRLLRRSAEEVILGYDSDGAGQTAILRGMEILKSMGVDTRVLQITDAKDPDEYVVKFGPEKFKKCMDNAISGVEYKVKNLRKNYDINNVSDKINFLNEIAKVLSEIDNTMEREVYVDKLSKNYGISKEAIYAEVNKRVYKEANTKILERKPEIKATKSLDKIDAKTLRREQMLIYLLINETNESFKRIESVVEIELIKDEKNKEIISTIFQKIKNNENIENILSWFNNDEIINYISGILAYDFEISDVQKAIQDIEKAYLRENKIQRRQYIISKLSQNNIEQTEKEQLEKELTNITIDLARMK